MMIMFTVDVSQVMNEWHFWSTDSITSWSYTFIISFQKEFSLLLVTSGTRGPAVADGMKDLYYPRSLFNSSFQQSQES